MDIVKLRSVLGWSTVINFVLLVFFSMMILIGKEFIYGLWSHFVTISYQAYDIIMISFIGFWKIVVIVFFLIPYIAIGIVNKKEHK